jgi:hypothetical protein
MFFHGGLPAYGNHMLTPVFQRHLRRHQRVKCGDYGERHTLRHSAKNFDPLLGKLIAVNVCLKENEVFRRI